MKHERVVCLNCIDGRVQIPVIEWIKKNYQVEHVDMITEPGMDGILSDAAGPLDNITAKIGISVEKNDSAIIFVAGHYDCRGNPVTEEEHKEQVKKGVQRIGGVFPSMPVVGLWVNDTWNVEKV